MKNCDSHIILYAKHHYVQSDMWKDLARILEVRNCILAEHFSKRDIFENIIDITMRYVKMDAVRMAQFLTDISPDKWWMWSEKRSLNVDISEYDYYEAVTKKCLNLLAIAKVIEDKEPLIILDDADPTVLPINPISRYYKGEKDAE